MDKIERFFLDCPIDYDDKCRLWFDFIKDLVFDRSGINLIFNFIFMEKEAKRVEETKTRILENILETKEYGLLKLTLEVNDDKASALLEEDPPIGDGIFCYTNPTERNKIISQVKSSMTRENFLIVELLDELSKLKNNKGGRNESNTN